MTPREEVDYCLMLVDDADVRIGTHEVAGPMLARATRRLLAHETTDYRELFIQLFSAVAACEAPQGSQVDDVLETFQNHFDTAGGRA